MTTQHTPSPASAGAVSAVQPATVEGLMALVERYVSAEIEWWDRKRGTTKDESDAIRAYAKRLAAPPAPTPAVPVEAKQEPLWQRHETRIKELMARAGFPDSMALFQAFKQFAQEFASPTAGTPAPAVPTEAIGRVLTEVMDRAVANGANSVSMPDDYVAIAAWLAGIPAAPAAPAPLAPSVQVPSAGTPAASDEPTTGNFRIWPPGAAPFQVAVAPHGAAGPYPTAMRDATPEEVSAVAKQFASPMAVTDEQIEAMAHRMAYRYLHISANPADNSMASYTFDRFTLLDFARSLLSASKGKEQ